MKRRMFLSLSSNDVRGNKLGRSDLPPVASAKSCVDVSGSAEQSFSSKVRHTRAATLPRNFHERDSSSRTSIGNASEQSHSCKSENYVSDSDDDLSQSNTYSSDEELHEAINGSESLIRLAQNMQHSSECDRSTQIIKPNKPRPPPRSTSLRDLLNKNADSDAVHEPGSSSHEINLMRQLPAEEPHFHSNVFPSINSSFEKSDMYSSSPQSLRSSAHGVQFAYFHENSLQANSSTARDSPRSSYSKNVPASHSLQTSENLGQTSNNNSRYNYSTELRNPINKYFSVNENALKLDANESRSCSSGACTDTTRDGVVDGNAWYTSYLAARRAHSSRLSSMKIGIQSDKWQAPNNYSRHSNPSQPTLNKIPESDTEADKIHFSPVPRERTMFISKKDPSRYSPNVSARKYHVDTFAPTNYIHDPNKEFHTRQAGLHRPLEPPSYESVVQNLRFYPVWHEGNHYGTPKPPSQPLTSDPRNQSGPKTSSSAGILPGAHPSSEGKRRRNRSNVEAMAANMTEPMTWNSPLPNQYSPQSNMPQQQHLPELRDHTGPTHESSYSASNLQFGMNNDVAMPPAMHPPNDLPDVAGPPDGDLGPLPPNWEQAYTDKGEPYFIDHVAGTSSWLDPRLAKVQKQKAEECAEDELPYGWERIDDPQYGTYYIDHVNRLTQYENPVTMAKTHTDPISDSSPQEAPLPQDQTAINNGGIASNGTSNNNNNNNNNTFPRQKKLSPDGGASMPPKPDGDNSNPGRVSQPPSVASKRNSSTWNTMNSTVDGKPAPVFTRNPAELRGEFLSTQLIKSSRGLGFTIVGGDDTKDEFLQIKSVVPNGPAWQDGNLRTGDVLVYVNDTCVLGYTHADVVNIFQNIEPGRSVYLEVCRGYPLPFDPNDPNTEIVTTVAVTAMDSRSAKSMFGESYERSRHNSNESLNTAKSMPDLSNPDRVQQVPRPGSADLLNSENFDTAPDILDFYNSNMAKPEYLTIPIVKGSMGFGFTIADSAYGQKVKKILDRSRCKNLMEGDILVDINSINVKRMSHTEVVQVLKECAQGQEAIVMVERGGADSPSKNRPRKEPLPSPKKALIGPSSAGSVFPTGQYRSKTPTADMYSSQTKEVIPNRPKTPLVDTRNRPKTPNLVGDGRPYADMTRPLAESVDSRVPDPQGPTGHYPGLYSPNHPPPPHHDMPYDPKLTSVSQQMSNVTLDGSSYSYYNNNDVSRSSAGLDYNYPNNGPMPPQNYSYPNNSSFPSESGYHPNSESYEYDMKRSMSKTPIQDPYYSPYPNSSQPQPYNQYYANDATRSLPSNGNSLMLNNANIINNNLGNNGHNTSIDNAGGNGYMPYPKDGFDVPRQDSGYSSQTQLPPAPNPYHAYYNPTDGHGMQAGAPGYGYSNDNGLVRRKESTSFEHEHPAPVSMPRFPDGRYTVGQRGTRGPPNGNAAPVHEFTVTLRRQETGFGFRIVGGTEEGSQVSIGHIVSGGAADQDGTVLTGDEILAVNGESVVGASHHRAVTLMAAAATRGVVTLTLCRRQPPDLHNRSLELSFPYDITVTRREDEGFGFVIISSVTKSGSTIGRIIEGSPAERCGKLHVGDRILAVNGVDIKSLHHGSIVNLIKLSGYSVTLTIGAPRDDSSSSTNSLKADSDVGDDSGEYMSVELMRGPRGFGFSIRGGREFQQMPLFVLRIAEGGPADHDSKLKVGDQLIEINGQSTKGMTHADAIELIKQSNNTVSLLVKRGGKIPQHLGDPLSSGGVVSPVGPPPPHTNIRSTATLPSPSHSPAYPPPPPSHHHPPPPHHNSNNPYPPPSSLHNPSQPPYVYPHNGSVRYQPPSLQSSPAGQYISPMNPNGPLGQSSPRVISSENYWARMPQ
ncbi:membrane-associated guanylate kinase, WW and PDZ domain-containing protein 1 isoform X5 [Hyalella azteca]|uniref:Membrane-associated guanylate kinase, WW and PDZ domain-containing protein 1 isoform X5 n=1 Tax=Hyalella azteca TaxID=294128 RepID=A0A979FT72_HYAAZ|nr:membrane-associated guanylate kinase, WW and PDZ domain-containing protein 1 isoform X5 [Hyalella azteca]